MLARKPTVATPTRGVRAAASAKTSAASQAQAIAAAKRSIRKQAAEIASLSEAQDELFAAMLAEMDSRIDEITARTDRLLAQHG